MCTLISPHSQSVDATRELTGWENKINNSTLDESYRLFAITPQVTLSYQADRIAECFFGESICKNRFQVAGSRVHERDKAAWLADYFGLPTDYNSTVFVEPRIAQAMGTISYYGCLNSWLKGLYVRAHSSLVYARWDLNMCETFISTGSNAHDPGYFSSESIDRENLSETFSAFMKGASTPQIADATFKALQCGLMEPCSQRLTRLADIQLAIGYNILQNKDYHFGFNIRCAIPTGNKRNAHLLFEPIIGNGGHWELGGGITTHILFWQEEEFDEYAAIYFDINLTHMFANDQCRSFDLCHNPNSRYMLAQRMSSFIEDDLVGIVEGEATTPTYQFSNEFSPLINLTTLPVSVSNSIQADFALMMGYTQQRNSWTLGYGFWGRSCDDVALCKVTPFDLQLWALKGDSHVFGFENTIAQTAVPLSATNSNATIHHGTNFAPKHITQSQIDTGKTNPKIDNAVPASTGTSSFIQLRSQPGGSNRIKTSVQPILITTKDINCDSARTRGLAHKFFSSFTHTIERDEIVPYLGFGAQIEFGQKANNCVNGEPKNCVNTAPSVWAVWLKTGVSF